MPTIALGTALALDQVAGLRGSDAVFGIAISLWLLYGAGRGAIRAIDHLMDREWDDAKRQRLIAIVAQDFSIKGMYDLRTRTSGTRNFAQFHIAVAPAMRTGWLRRSRHGCTVRFLIPKF